ncbi:MAG: lipopolysaccharide biosynthesis protein [Minisyncoccota bacterium]
MNNLKVSLHGLLRKSERFFKTDMVYVAQGGFWLGVGQAASALIAFISSLFFANLISKDIYGNYKFIIATTSILAGLSLTGMGSVVAQGVAKGFEGILKTAVRSTLRWGSIIVLVALCISTYYFTHENTVLGFSMLIAGLSLPLSQAYTLYGNYLVGKKDFKKVTLYAVGSQLLNTAGLITVAILTKNIVYMVLTYFALNTLSTIWAYRHTLKIFNINDTHDHSLIPYGKHLSIMGFLGTVANQFDKILVFHYLGSWQLAIYAFAQAIPDQFKGVLKNIFGIALPKYAELSDEDLRESIMKKFAQLSLLTALAVLAYILTAQFIFSVLFPKYLEAVFYSEIYMLGMITIPGISLFGIYFQLKKATRKMYELNLIGNISTLIVTFVLIYKFGLEGAVIANGASWLIMLTAHWYYFIKDKQKQIISI